MRETGRPKLTFFAVAVAVAVSLPLAFWFGLHTAWGLPGVWLAMSSAWYLCGTVFLIVLCRFTNWDEEARKAMERGQGCGNGSLNDVTGKTPALDEEQPKVGLEMAPIDNLLNNVQQSPSGKRQAKYSMLAQNADED